MPAPASEASSWAMAGKIGVGCGAAWVLGDVRLLAGMKALGVGGRRGVRAWAAFVKCCMGSGWAACALYALAWAARAAVVLLASAWQRLVGCVNGLAA